MNNYFLLSIITICWALQPYFKKVPLKKISSSEFYVLNHILYSIPIIIYIIYMIYYNQFGFLKKLDKNDYLHFVLVVLVGIIGGIVFIQLLKQNKANYVIPHVQPLVITFTIISGFLFFNEYMNWKQLSGVTLIICGLLIINLCK